MAAREIAGKQIEFDEEGFMANPDEWDKDVAAALAADIGVEPLTDRHWQVIEFCRSDFQVKGDAPTLRRNEGGQDHRGPERRRHPRHAAAEISAHGLYFRQRRTPHPDSQ